MSAVIHADARPEKRLFISLLTRDIPLIAAFLDLVDNSINAAAEPYSDRLKSADEYVALLGDDGITPSVEIFLTVSKDRIEIRDTASGISSKTAEEHVFKFGRGTESSNGTDRLSVYGIGLKRALFKLGNKIVMRSDHVEGGFDMKLDVSKWARLSKQPWTFDITKRPPVETEKTGTTIVVTELYDEVVRRITDGLFEGQLREAVARTYSYYLAKLVTIKVNETPVEGLAIEFGSNHGNERFTYGAVNGVISAGVGVPENGAFREKLAGWYVFCNGRNVVSADKGQLTGWGSAGLPTFQPKHRPFKGTVFFVSEDPEQLPWTTTKAGINEDSVLWQTAKRHMAVVGRSVITFLDGRYSEDGTEISSRELQDAFGGGKVNALSAAVARPQKFQAPTTQHNTTVKIQYDAMVDDIKRVAKHLRRSSMSGSDVGRYTFQHFLRNEVGDE